MTEITFAVSTGTSRAYSFELPHKIPVLGVGFAMSKLKEIGVWEGLPRTLRVKIKSARESWSCLKITKSDLDTIPDEVWQRIASEFNLKWRPAQAA